MFFQRLLALQNLAYLPLFSSGFKFFPVMTSWLIADTTLLKTKEKNFLPNSSDFLSRNIHWGKYDYRVLIVTRLDSKHLTDHFTVWQTFLGQKFWPPHFFLENILAVCPKVGGSKNFPPLDPLGPQNPYLGVRPPKTEKLPILQGIFFYLLADHVGH